MQEWFARQGEVAIVGSLMRCSMLLVALFSLGCKGDCNSQGGATAARNEPAGQAQVNGELPPLAKPVRIDDDSAQGRALARLARLEIPTLGPNPLCVDYGKNMSSFLASMNHEIERLGALGQKGVSGPDFMQFSAWLQSRAETLDNMAASTALASGELGRLHRELHAAAVDLADSLSTAYKSTVEPGPEAQTRVENAVENFASTLGRLGALCTNP